MDMEATHDIDSSEDRLDRKIRAVLGEFARILKETLIFGVVIHRN